MLTLFGVYACIIPEMLPPKAPWTLPSIHCVSLRFQVAGWEIAPGDTAEKLSSHHTNPILSPKTCHSPPSSPPVIRQLCTFQDFMTPEDLFAAFFGGGPAFHQAHHGRHHHHDEGQMQRVQIFQALPVLLLAPRWKMMEGVINQPARMQRYQDVCL